MSLLLSTLPAPFDWLSWGLLTGPVGLALIGVGIWGLHGASGSDPDAEACRTLHERNAASGR